jgi:hypothetical protein
MSRLRSLAALVPALVLGARALAQAPSAASPAWIDFDGDGRIDLALLDETGGFHLYRNEATGFREVTAEAGLARLVDLRLARWADFDRDGRADLVVASTAGELELLRSGGGGFEPVDARLGTGGVMSAEWMDVDDDGWSDLWIRGEEGWRIARNERGGLVEPVESVELPLAGHAAPSPERSERDGVARELASGAGVPDPDASAGSRGSSTGRESSSSSARAAAGSLPHPAPTIPPPDTAPATFFAPCARTLFNEANAGCLSASSIPTLGKLYPLSTALNVDTSGRVGMGTSGPTHRLTVSSVNDDTLRLIGAGAFGSQARLNFGDGDLVYLYEDVDDNLEIHSSGRTALTGGFVGIGTLFPGWPLHVVGSQGVGRFDSTSSTFGSVIELRNYTANPTAVGAINFVNAQGQYKGQIAYTGTNALTFGVNAAEAMRIDSTGDVGIGTTTPTAQLHVQTNTQAIRGTSFSDAGVTGEAFERTKSAVLGIHYATLGGGSFASGVSGQTALVSGYGMFSFGNLGANGTKSFVQPHPSDPSKEIRFVCLEGNESGTYFRGSARLAGGRAVIDVPEEFRLVSEPDGLTVQVTPRGPARAWVERVDLDEIEVRGDLDVPFDYFVNGVRRGFADVELVRENESWVPAERDVPFGTQYPDALRRILVENGTLNPDFTPNEATAARLGWELRDAVESPWKPGGSR